MSRYPNAIDCPSCGLAHTIPVIQPREVARCSRCKTEFARHIGKSPGYLSALSLTALICWCLTLFFPIASVNKLGLSNNGYLIKLGQSYREHDQLLLGAAVDIFAIIMPSLLFLALPIVASSPLPNRLAKLCAFAKRWAMPEVFMLSILVSFTKIGALATASLETGFWTLSAGTILLIHVLQNLNLPQPPERKSHTTAWALLIAACITLIPANVLPIMTVARGPDIQSRTIIGGILQLFNEGMWGIALIVFIASILVPFLKLGGLAWLLRASRKKLGSPQSVKTYSLLDFIGRWSMLDIFLIGVLAGLIEFGQLAYVEPGPAAPAFAAAVVLTVIAVESFDTRTLFARDSKLYS